MSLTPLRLRRAELRRQTLEAEQTLIVTREARIRGNMDEDTHMTVWRKFYEVDCERQRSEAELHFLRGLYTAEECRTRLHPTTCKRHLELQETAERLRGMGAQAGWNSAKTCPDCGTGYDRDGKRQMRLDGSEDWPREYIQYLPNNHCCCPHCGAQITEVVSVGADSFQEP